MSHRPVATTLLTIGFALAGAVALPVIVVQGYKVFVGPLSFDVQLLVVIVVSVFSGIGLYFFYRSSARNEP